MATSYGRQDLLRAAALLIGMVGGIIGRPEPSMAAQPPAAQAASSDWHATVRDFAAKHFKNPAWGFSHCMRDYALARELAAADHVILDDDVLFAAAYLHDMAAFPPWENQKLDHSDVAAGIVDTVLKGTGFPMAKIDAVREAIRTHMYYTVKMLEENLSKVPKRVLSPAGRALAAPRKAELERFLVDLRRESENLRTL